MRRPRGRLVLDQAPRRVSLTRGAPGWAPLGMFGMLLAAALGLSGAGCQRVCVRHSDCPVDYLCEPSGLCVLPPPPPAVDASPDDSEGVPGLPDGSFDETGEADAATPDAAPVDAASLPPDDS